MRHLLLIAALMSSVAMAKEVTVSNCIIQEVLPGKHMTGAFVTFDNESEQAVVLEKAAVNTISDHVELHEMKHEDGVMKMQQISQYELVPGKTEFKKGGYHVMIMDIPEAPQVGSEHEMTFTFANGQKVSCEAIVMSVDDVMAHFDQEKNAMNHDHSHDNAQHKTHH